MLPAGPFSFAGVFAPQIVAVRTFELNMSWIIWHLVDDRGALADGSGRGHHDVDAPLIRFARRTWYSRSRK